MQVTTQSTGSPPGDLAVPPANHGYRTVNLRPERLGTTREAARAIVKRHRLPRSRSNDGKTMVTVDLDELHHKPLPARSQRGHQSVTEAVATLKARVAELEAELAKAEERSAGHRADFERERDRTDQMVTAQDRLITELENLRALLQTAQQPATPQPASRLVRAWRWMRATA
jgi:uncharacterized membrane protein YccC